MTRKLLLCAIGAMLCADLSELASADTVNLGSVLDNTMYSSSGDLSNGSGPVMFAGKTGGEVIHRALIQFDIAAGIPAGSTITSASLTLNMSRTSDVEPADVRLHRVSAAWGEGASSAGSGGGPGEGGGGGDDAEAGDATWTHRIYPGATWTDPGGDFDPNESATQEVGSELDFYTWESTSRLVSDVQSWLDNPSTNFGWIIRGNEGPGGTSRRFDTHEHPTPGNRPVLTIEYTTGGPTADFTGEGDVDGADLAIWEAGYGVDDAGDTDSDGDTDGVDFLNWQQQYTGPPALAAVPEPSGALLALVTTLAAASVRYRL